MNYGGIVHSFERIGLKILNFRHKKTSLKLEILLHHFSIVEEWCPRPDSNWHALWAGDFKSPVSTDFTTRAF